MSELVSRRTILRCCALGTVPGVAGCNVNVNVGRTDDEEGEPGATLRVSPGVERTETSWQMNVRVRNTTSYDFSIHDVTVVAFSEEGEEVCHVHMGDFPQGGRWEETKTVDCETFPAIVTAIAEETPCDGAHIRMLYYTSEKDPATVNDLSNHRLWEGRWRECDEELPPEHVVEEVRKSGATTDEE